MTIEELDYFKDGWNYLDLAGTVLVLLHCILMWTGVLSRNGDGLLAFAVFL